ncbi:hypothetical protein C8J57DRAFT_1247403 [Mycena rebaudengoi]|nr:hypothetical protein C8J57DRAFT_1247403 [Mycena rebaudengoi]
MGRRLRICGRTGLWCPQVIIETHLSLNSAKIRVRLKEDPSKLNQKIPVDLGQIRKQQQPLDSTPTGAGGCCENSLQRTTLRGAGQLQTQARSKDIVASVLYNTNLLGAGRKNRGAHEDNMQSVYAGEGYCTVVAYKSGARWGQRLGERIALRMALGGWNRNALRVHVLILRPSAWMGRRGGGIAASEIQLGTRWIYAGSVRADDKLDGCRYTCGTVRVVILTEIHKIPTEHKPIPGGRSHKTLTDWDWLALEQAGPLDTTLWDLTTNWVAGVREEFSLPRCTKGTRCGRGGPRKLVAFVTEAGREAKRKLDGTYGPNVTSNLTGMRKFPYHGYTTRIMAVSLYRAYHGTPQTCGGMKNTPDTFPDVMCDKVTTKGRGAR